MDEQNKQPEQNKPEKKLSRTTLTFYIVGLFSVAIADRGTGRNPESGRFAEAV